jgi:hypothetical protein
MQTQTLRAGAAAVDITPAIGTPLAGQFHRRLATTVVDPLHARAVVIESGGPVENGGTRIVFVLLDLVGLIDEDAIPLRQAIGEVAGVLPSNVCISCTHTHFGPGIKDGATIERNDAYFEWAIPQIVESARQAVGKLQPARAAWGKGHESRPQYNRRFHMRDGSVKMNPGRDFENIIRPAGPTDPEIPMLLLESASGTPIALIANYSLHYVGDYPETGITSDYFGTFAAMMKERKGNEFVALLTHGASGDINNINHQKLPEPWYPESMATGEKSRIVAGMISDQVEAIWQQAEWHTEATVAATEDIYQLIVRKPSEAELEEARHLSKLENPTARDLRYSVEPLELMKWPDVMPKVVQSLRVGDWAASAFPGEIFCQFGLNLKDASPFGVTALIDLANGYCGYIPTLYSHTLGGYETWLCRSSFAKPGTGEDMIALATAQLRKLRKSDLEDTSTTTG